MNDNLRYPTPAAFRVAILSFWHVHAEDYAREAAEHPGAEVVAVWDEDPERGRREADRRGVPFHEDLAELLARDDVDGVVVTTPTTAHIRVIPAAARAGKHVFAEKVIAPTLRESWEISAAVEASGVTFTVSLPRLYAGYTRAFREAIEGGEIGEVTYLRVRVAHDGALPRPDHPEGWLPERFFEIEESGGGVQIDFGAHPLYLIQTLLGPPEWVNAAYGHFTGKPAEDNAVTVLRYPNGALAVAESSFLGGASPFTIEAHGTTGSLVYEEDTGLRLRRSETGAVWETREAPPDDSSPFSRWVDLASRGEPDPENVRSALALSALAEAAGRSAVEGRSVRLDPTYESQP